MNKDLLQSILRIALTSLGAILAKRGWIDSPTPDAIDQIIGPLCLALSAIWSAIHQAKMKGTAPASGASKVIILCAGLALGASGCSTPNRTAYQSLATIATTVNASLKVYNEYYQAGKSSDTDREKVKAAYETYQAAMLVAQRVEESANSAPDGRNKYLTAVEIVSASAGSVVKLIENITGGK